MNKSTQQIATDALSFAHHLVDEVAEVLLNYFGGTRDADVKADGTLITQADLEANRLIVGAIQSQYPDHDIISEELNTVYEGAPWCWIVDPLDGTTNFTQGVPVWAVSIALAHAGWPVMGLVDVPPLGIRYHAVKGAGAFETRTGIDRGSGRAIRVMPAVDLADSERLQNELFAMCSRTLQRYRVDVPMKPRVIGAAAYNFCLTAAGICVTSMDVTPKVWDMAAGWLLVHEAGGVVQQLEGTPIFPLVAGRDYAATYYPQLSASTASVARDLQRRIRHVR